MDIQADNDNAKSGIAQTGTIDVTPQVVCNDIGGLLKYFKMHIAELAELHGLTSIQLYALTAMQQEGSSMGKLAQTLHCDASNVTGIVDRLSALDLITRQENPLDRRVKTLQLTTRGCQVLAAANSELPGRLNCTALSAAERVTLHKLLSKINPTNIV